MVTQFAGFVSWQAPPTHVWLPHEYPHAPQLSGSLERLVSQMCAGLLSQWAIGGVHLCGMPELLELVVEPLELDVVEPLELDVMPPLELVDAIVPLELDVGCVPPLPPPPCPVPPVPKRLDPVLPHASP